MASGDVGGDFAWEHAGQQFAGIQRVVAGGSCGVGDGDGEGCGAGECGGHAVAGADFWDAGGVGFLAGAGGLDGALKDRATGPKYSLRAWCSASLKHGFLQMVKFKDYFLCRALHHCT